MPVENHMSNKSIPSQTRTKINRGKHKIKARENKISNFSYLLIRLVAPPRLELGTQGSSGLCSTN